ncbi:MAG: radical SAM protein [Planctomycetia bacterium]|nr:radical SAM protein [Planctomycetia bacterium]
MLEHPCIRRERTRLKRMQENLKIMQDTEQYPRSFQMPIGIQYELTANCNLRCKHCYNRSGDQDVQNKMRPEDWIRLSQNIVEHGGVFQTILSGGEPLLLGNHLIKIMDIMSKDQSGFLLISNGLLMDDIWVKKLQKYPFYWIQISIDDSQKEKHDEFRGYDGSWQAAVNAALRISSAGLPLVVAHTINPDNMNHLPEMVELAYQLGANSLICGETMISGRAAQNDFLWLNDEQRNRMFSIIETLQKEWVDKISIRYSIPESIELASREGMPNRAVIIRPNGDVRIDCMLPFTIGNVLETPFVDIWRSKGINCWNNPDVKDYISQLQPGIKNTDYVNHVTRDRRI